MFEWPLNGEGGIDMWLLLCINRKLYMGSLMAQLNLILSDHERSISMSLRF